MHSELVVTSPASDLSLLTEAERREAVGVTDASLDDRLAGLDVRLAAAIMAECGIAIGAGAGPTLLQETLTETFWDVYVGGLELARRHNVEVVSIIENETTLVSGTDFISKSESGLLIRLSGNRPRRWCATKVVVVYKAGFVTVPGDLKQAAMDFMRLAWAEKSRDPSLKSVETDIPDVRRESKTFWVGSIPGQSEGAVPDIVAGQLQRFRNIAIG